MNAYSLTTLANRVRLEPAFILGKERAQLHRITTFKVIQNFGVNCQWGILDRHRTRKGRSKLLGLSRRSQPPEGEVQQGQKEETQTKTILFEDFRDEEAELSLSSTSGID